MEDLKATMENMAKQFAGVQEMVKQFPAFQQMMTTTIDKLNNLEAWRTIAETSMRTMMQQSKETTTRVQQLETRPPPPPPQSPLQPPPPMPMMPTQQMVPHQPPPWFDLNVAPALSHHSASTSQSPNGHDLRQDHRVAGVGTPWVAPPHPVTGMAHDHIALVFPPVDSEFMHGSRSMPVPKMDFPKFDGDNPRL
jgi:hypothetical protein